MERRTSCLRAVLLSSGMFSLAFGPGLPAQGTRSPDPPTGSEAASPGEPVRLVARFVPGVAQRYTENDRLDMTMTVEGPAVGGSPGSKPFTFQARADYVNKTTGVKEGIASVTTLMRSVSMTTTFLGQRTVVKSQGGKASITRDGKSVPASSLGLSPEYEKALVRSAPIVTRRDTLGRILESSVDFTGGGMFAALAQSFQLPEGAVSVGDAWETAGRMALDLPGLPVSRTGTGAEVDIRFTHRLKALETKNGKRFAVIASSGSGTLARRRRPIQALSQAVKTSSRFDVSRGLLVSQNIQMDFSVTAALPRGRRGGGPSEMRLDGRAQSSIREVPLAATAYRSGTKKAAAKRR